jgi:hypothetical protein
MASNELEVLDPAATVEKIENAPAGRALNRRNLMAGLGIAGAALGAGLVTRRSASRPSVVEAASFPSTFTQTDYLNFLLNIKYLQATFYSYVTQGADIPANYTVNGTLYRPNFGTALVNHPLAAKIAFTGANAAQITDMLNEIYYDELNQLINLQSLIGPLGTVAITRPLIDLLGTNTNITAGSAAVAGTLTGSVALAQARLLEDLSVTAFAGAAGYLTGTNLTAAAQIFAVDGLHAGAIRLAIILQNTATPGTVVDLVGQSDIVPAVPGNFLNVQPDDVAPVDPGSATTSAAGPQASTAQQVLATATGSQAITSTSITAITVPANFVVGNPIYGANIPVGAKITAVSGTTITISVATTNTAAATGVLLLTPAPQLQLINCTAPIAPYTLNGNNYVACSAAQYQGFFATTGLGTASISSPPAGGFAFKRTPSQVLSVLFAAAPGAAPAAPALPTTQVPPISTVVTTGGFFPQGVGGQILVASDT